MTIGEYARWHKEQIGTLEAGKNNVRYNTDYYGHPVNGDSYAWCCVYQWDGCRENNSSTMFYDGQKTASCGTLFNWAKRKGLVVDKPAIGDWVEFTFNGKEHCHIGWILGFDKNGKMYTVEGNTSRSNAIGADQANGDGVYLKVRPMSQVYGFIRPKYKEVPTKVVHNMRAITVWSAPLKIDACRTRTINPQDITVYDEIIPSFSGEGDKFYRTIKGFYVLEKYCV